MKAKRNGIVMNKELANETVPVTEMSKPRKVEFIAKAAAGSKVFLVGSFNNWDPKATAMKHNGDSQYKRAVSLPAGHHEYKFIINDTWHIDEQCPQWVPNAYGSLNSVVEVT